jgi:hypothetical protein
MPRARAAVLAAAALLPALAAPQPYDAYNSVVVSSGRVIGLGGAFVGVGEGIGGATVNPASVAQRDRHNTDTWDLDGILTWYLPQPEQLGDVDLSNDGETDGDLASSGTLLLGGSGQVGRLGAGVLMAASAVGADRSPTERVEIGTLEIAVAVGWSGWRESLVLGASLTSAVGVVDVGPPEGTGGSSLEYTDSVIRVGALWRPRGRPFRLGLAYRPGNRAQPEGDRDTFPVATPSEFVFPWVLSAGASMWLGANARLYNEPPPIALDRHPEWGAGPAYEPGRRMPVLVSLQVDLVGATPGAVSIASALLQSPVPEPSGENASVAVKAGAEWEAWPRWARIRGGGYLEPSRTGASPRLHATFGAEVRIPFWPWDLQIGFTGDVASLYQNVSLSIGFWGDYGPAPPPRAPGS